MHGFSKYSNPVSLFTVSPRSVSVFHRAHYTVRITRSLSGFLYIVHKKGGKKIKYGRVKRLRFYAQTHTGGTYKCIHVTCVCVCVCTIILLSPGENNYISTGLTATGVHILLCSRVIRHGASFFSVFRK